MFNRPDTTRRVFEAIRAARPPRLYVAADGPRLDRLNEAAICDEVRAVATAVDWPCEVHTLFRDENLGCGHGVASAINWFLTHEPHGIILEDDCLPHPDFFGFCTELLERYADDERVAMIPGYNPKWSPEQETPAKRVAGTVPDGAPPTPAAPAATPPAAAATPATPSYGFSGYTHVWGWATWRRAWRHFDFSMSFWPSWRDSESWRRAHPTARERAIWRFIFNQTYAGGIDTWDYQWYASAWYRGMLSIAPYTNLISNIGFGPEATHTTRFDPTRANSPSGGILPLVHPSEDEVARAASIPFKDESFGRMVDSVKWSPWLSVRAIAHEFRRSLPRWLGGRPPRNPGSVQDRRLPRFDA